MCRYTLISSGLLSNELEPKKTLNGHFRTVLYLDKPLSDFKQTRPPVSTESLH